MDYKPHCGNRALAYCAYLCVAFTLVGCVSFPLPPSGDDAGKWGWVDVRVQYRPNFQTLINQYSKPNPDLPSPETLNQK